MVTSYFSALSIDNFTDIISAHNGPWFVNNALPSQLLLAKGDTWEMFYAPFDHVESSAEVVVVGITPGLLQAENALTSLRTSLRQGLPLGNAMRLAKHQASFSGKMRNSLVAMLDHVGLHKKFRLETCSKLFEPESKRAHFTSALRYPVFAGGKNYNGTPDMLRTPQLRTIVDCCLAAEARALPNAVWLPLGPRAQAAVMHLASSGLISENRVLANLPHPSGANAERIAYFMGRKPAAYLSGKTSAASLDQARGELIEKILRMGDES